MDARDAVAPRKQCVDQRPQRREADAAGDDHHVATVGQARPASRGPSVRGRSASRRVRGHRSSPSPRRQRGWSARSRRDGSATRRSAVPRRPAARPSRTGPARRQAGPALSVRKRSVTMSLVSRRLSMTSAWTGGVGRGSARSAGGSGSASTGAVTSVDRRWRHVALPVRWPAAPRGRRCRPGTR